MPTMQRTCGVLKGILFAVLAIAIHLSIFQGQVAHGWPTQAGTTLRHALLQPQPSRATHVHSDGEVTEQVRGHSHSHNPSDHSHDTPLNVLVDFPQPSAIAPRWNFAEDAKMRDLGPSRLERPPSILP